MNKEIIDKAIRKIKDKGYSPSIQLPFSYINIALEEALKLQEEKFRERLLKQRQRYFKKVKEITGGKCICTDEWLDAHDQETQKAGRDRFLKLIYNKIKEHQDWLKLENAEYSIEYDKRKFCINDLKELKKQLEKKNG